MSAASNKLVFLEFIQKKQPDNFQINLNSINITKEVNLAELFTKYEKFYEATKTHSESVQSYSVKLGKGSKGESQVEERGKISKEELTEQFKTIVRAKTELIKEINSNSCFLEIKSRLKTILKQPNSLILIISTDNPTLQKIPWISWDLFEQFPQLGVALRLQENLAVDNPIKSPATGERPSLLHIIADPGEGNNPINLDLQEQIMSSFPNLDREIAAQKTYEDLTKLWFKKNLIVLYSGHSNTLDNKEDGSLSINKNLKVKLENIKHLLEKSNQEGLQLLIFNGCDGLGLATNSTSYSEFPARYVIFWPEPVIDVVAAKFLKYFFHFFIDQELALELAFTKAVKHLMKIKLFQDQSEVKIGEYSCLPVLIKNSKEEISFNQLRGFTLNNNQSSGDLTKLRDTVAEELKEKRSQHYPTNQLILPIDIDIPKELNLKYVQTDNEFKKDLGIENIVNIFDKNKSLLIIGGEYSIVVQQIAEELIKRAKYNPEVTVPVFIDISDSDLDKVNDQNIIIQFLDNILKTKPKSKQSNLIWHRILEKYQAILSNDYLEKLLEEKKILPIICLNNAQTTNNTLIIRKINDFKQEFELDRLIVCCSQEPYDPDVFVIKFALEAAVVLKSPEEKDIKAYLEDLTLNHLYSDDLNKNSIEELYKCLNVTPKDHNPERGNNAEVKEINALRQSPNPLEKNLNNQDNSSQSVLSKIKNIKQILLIGDDKYNYDKETIVIDKINKEHIHFLVENNYQCDLVFINNPEINNETESLLKDLLIKQKYIVLNCKNGYHLGQEIKNTALSCNIITWEKPIDSIAANYFLRYLVTELNSNNLINSAFGNCVYTAWKCTKQDWSTQYGKELSLIIVITKEGRNVEQC